MKLKEIKQYKYKNAYYGTTTELNINVFYSYNTLIAVSIDNITFITDAYYSNTTAHHKTDAIRFYNNNTIIKVTQEALESIATGNHTRKQAITEYKQKQILKSFLKGLNKFDCVTEREAFINNTEFIKQETKNYKNGNKLKTRTYKTTFKTVPNFIIIERCHIKKSQVQKFNGPKGPKGPYTINNYNKKYMIKRGVNS